MAVAQSPSNSQSVVGPILSLRLKDSPGDGS
jgi:hypothetical protein